jgi:hypothetical protein
MESYSARWGKPPELPDRRPEPALDPERATHLESVEHAVAAALADHADEVSMDAPEL